MAKRHNYKEIDRTAEFNWRSERLAIAQKMGYKYISESIVKTYRKLKSGVATSLYLGGIVGAPGILLFLKKIGEIKRKEGETDGANV